MVVLSTVLRFWQEGKSTRPPTPQGHGQQYGHGAAPRRGRWHRGSAGGAGYQAVGTRRCDLAVGRRHDSSGLPRAHRQGFVRVAVSDDGRIHAGGKVRRPQRPQTINALDLENLVFMGTNVVSGSGHKAVVLPPGNNTYFGALANRVVATDRAPTAFYAGVNQVSWLLIRFMFVMAPLVFFINGFTKGDWMEALLFALAIAVGLTPEMLP